MCGIAGIWRADGGAVSEVLLRAMTARLGHRGPDGGGIHREPGIGLGHRRLSIIDVAGGAQPLGNEDGSVQVSFNGEIYNHLALREHLEARGHRFRTRSDTEVIVHLYEEEGEGAVERLDGMFALAVWDRRRRLLLLARDRLGQKPLYVRDEGTRITFASELKALTVDPDLPREIDLDALEAYLTLGYVPAPLSIYRSVRKLPPGHLLVADPGGVRSRPYWRLRFGERRDHIRLDEAVQLLEERLAESVRRRLMSEVPLGAFLSGGIDSSLVVAHMQRQLGGGARTLAVDFADSRDSEARHAARVARELGTRHTELPVRPDASLLPRVAGWFDEPFADPSALPTWWLSEAARRHVTVALSGDGGDEAFGGYATRYPPHRIESALRRGLGPLARLGGPLSRVWPQAAWLPRPLRLRTLLANLSVPPSRAYLHDVSRVRPERRGLLAPELRGTAWARAWFEELFDGAEAAGARDALDRVLWVDARSFLGDGVLVKVDRMSMAHGLEVRSPLLDHRIYELAATLPSRLKVRGLETKRLLRAAARRHLPGSVAGRPKQGFDPPRARWLRGDLRPLMEAALDDAGSGLVGVVDRRGVRRAWEGFLEGGRDESPLFWTLLCLDLWHRAARADSPSAERLATRATVPSPPHRLREEDGERACAS